MKLLRKTHWFLSFWHDVYTSWIDFFPLSNKVGWLLIHKKKNLVSQHRDLKTGFIPHETPLIFESQGTNISSLFKKASVHHFAKNEWLETGYVSQAFWASYGHCKMINWLTMSPWKMLAQELYSSAVLLPYYWSRLLFLIVMLMGPRIISLIILYIHDIEHETILTRHSSKSSLAMKLLRASRTLA